MAFDHGDVILLSILRRGNEPFYEVRESFQIGKEDSYILKFNYT